MWWLRNSAPDGPWHFFSPGTIWHWRECPTTRNWLWLVHPVVSGTCNGLPHFYYRWVSENIAIVVYEFPHQGLVAVMPQLWDGPSEGLSMVVNQLLLFWLVIFVWFHAHCLLVRRTTHVCHKPPDSDLNMLDSPHGSVQNEASINPVIHHSFPH